MAKVILQEAEWEEAMVLMRGMPELLRGAAIRCEELSVKPGDDLAACMRDYLSEKQIPGVDVRCAEGFFGPVYRVTIPSIKKAITNLEVTYQPEREERERRWFWNWWSKPRLQAFGEPLFWKDSSR